MAVADKRQWTLPLALGLSDGALNALVLASGTFTGSGHGAGLGLTVKVGCVAFVTAFFTMFVAQYAELRARLSRAAYELNMPSDAHLLKSDLGQQVVQRSMAAALSASVSSFIGASVPLAAAALMPSAPWTGLVVSLVLLGGLGWPLLRWLVVTDFDGQLYS